MHVIRFVLSLVLTVWHHSTKKPSSLGSCGRRRLVTATARVMLLLEVNHRLESRMREIRPSGSEGGEIALRSSLPYPSMVATRPGHVTRLAKEDADRAIDLLQKAVKAGYKDAAHMAKVTDLEPLRAREDFK